jgi:hemerythrin
VLQFPGELLAKVPILRWKLFESYQQSVSEVIYRGDPKAVFVWRDTFSIQVAQMDSHHKRLLEIANAIMEQLHNNAPGDELAKSFDALINYTHYHFTAEEKLMILYGYPGAEFHIAQHSELFIQLNEYKENELSGKFPDKSSFKKYFEFWLMNHFLGEDRKYGEFLNNKGVY